MPKIVRASSIRSAADGPGSLRAGLTDHIDVGGLTLDRITLEPGVSGPEIVGEAGEHFLYVVRGGGVAGDLPLGPETMVWIEPGDRLRLLAGDEGLEVLLAGTDAPAGT